MYVSIEPTVYWAQVRKFSSSKWLCKLVISAEKIVTVFLIWEIWKIFKKHILEKILLQ